MKHLSYLLLLVFLLAAPRHVADALLYQGGPGTGGGGTYQGPCDAIAGGCAVAYDVDRSPTVAYTGPLFELWNGASTLNIGQTPNHTVDLSTYAAFCGGSMTSTTHNGTAVLVSTTCYYAAFYDAIHGSPNTLVPITINTQFGPNCSGAGTYVCAAPFEIEVATGLPIVDTRVANGSGFYGDYYIAGDANSTGVNGGTSPVSIIVNQQDQPTTPCCGNFLLAHLNSLPDSPADQYDFGPAPSYGTAGSFNHCGSSTVYCLAMEGGTGGSLIDYATSQGNVSLTGAFSSGIAGYVNSVDISPVPHATTDLAIHLGGGGDLSQPAPCFCREMLITNATMTQNDITNVQNSITSFYPGLTFAAPCGSC